MSLHCVMFTTVMTFSVTVDWTKLTSGSGWGLACLLEDYHTTSGRETSRGNVVLLIKKSSSNKLTRGNLGNLAELNVCISF